MKANFNIYGNYLEMSFSKGINNSSSKRKTIRNIKISDSRYFKIKFNGYHQIAVKFYSSQNQRNWLETFRANLPVNKIKKTLVATGVDMQEVSEAVQALHDFKSGKF